MEDAIFIFSTLTCVPVMILQASPYSTPEHGFVNNEPSDAADAAESILSYFIAACATVNARVHFIAASVAACNQGIDRSSGHEVGTAAKKQPTKCNSTLAKTHTTVCKDLLTLLKDAFSLAHCSQTLPSCE